MTDSFLTQVILPLALALIMFGMGLSLTKHDFIELGKEPKAILVGLFGQLLLLPILAYGVAILFRLDQHLAIGMMIVAACPGGTSSNIISQLARANLALSVSLTAVTTLVCVFTTPLIIQFAINQFDTHSDNSFSLLGTTLGLIFVTLLPVLFGIYLRQKYPTQAINSEPFFRRLAVGFLIFIIIALVYQERETILGSFSQVLLPSITLNLVAIATGLLLGFIFNLIGRDCVTLGIEVGIQNSGMAILIGVSFLARPDYAITAAVYGLSMYLGAGLLIWGAKRHTVKNQKK